MILISMKQHLSNILSSIHEKVKQHWGWIEKTVALKKPCSSVQLQKHLINITDSVAVFFIAMSFVFLIEILNF